MTQSARTVMVVDDDADMRDAVVEILADAGFRAIAAGNGQEALEMLLGADERPSLILLDLMMPVLDGWQFCAAQQRDPALADVPVVLMSAGAAPTQGEISGVAAVVQKPFEIETLLQVIAEHAR